MRPRLALVPLLASTMLVACSLFGLDGLSGGGDDAVVAAPSLDGGGSSDGSTTPAPDTGAAPGTPDASGDDPCAPTPNNLLEARLAAFEDGCAMWTGSRANLSTTTTAHCGKYACRLCPFYGDDPNGEMKLSPVDITLEPGDRYVFSAWIRREDGATTTTAKVAAGGDKVFYVEGTVPLMSEWGKSTAVYEVAESDLSTTLRLVVLPRKTANASSPDDCVVIDDAVLLKVK